MADERIKAYYDALWEMYLAAKWRANVKLVIKKRDWRNGYDWGYLQGVDDALEIFKSMFDLAEYAEGSEG
jgi:hypothetical protein